MTIADIERAREAFERDMAKRFPFNGTLSKDEQRLLAQGYGRFGTDYEKLLRTERLGEYA